MKATNINGTSDNTCKCTSWKAHWEKYSGEKFGTCVEKTCLNDATVGAHVQKEGSDDHWYIIPLCDTHNGKHGETLELYQTPKFVSANVAETCGKKQKD